jgi:hypothetical protein
LAAGPNFNHSRDGTPGDVGQGVAVLMAVLSTCRPHKTNVCLTESGFLAKLNALDL